MTTTTPGHAFGAMKALSPGWRVWYVGLAALMLLAWLGQSEAAYNVVVFAAALYGIGTVLEVAAVYSMSKRERTLFAEKGAPSAPAIKVIELVLALLAAAAGWFVIAAVIAAHGFVYDALVGIPDVEDHDGGAADQLRPLIEWAESQEGTDPPGESPDDPSERRWPRG